MIHNKKAFMPALRFKDFIDPWSLNKLSLFIQERSIMADDSFPLYSLTIEQGVVPKSKRYERSFLVKGDDEAYKVVKSGDFVFNPMNLRFGAIAKYEGSFDVAVSKYYNIFYCNKNCNADYLEYFLKSNKMVQFYNKMSTGTLEEKKRVHYLDFIHFKKYFPSLHEQQKIASFLFAVDEKIRHLTRKKELLEQYKNGVMQQLFSGKLRFKDENGRAYPKWEEKRLKEFCTFFSGGTPSSTNKKFYSGNIPFIGSGNIYDSEVSSFISEEALSNSSAKLVKKGDLLYALYGANSGEVAISKINGAINQAVLCIRSKESIEYLYYVLLFNKEKIVSKYLQGGQGNLSANIIKGLKYKLPSMIEQNKISSFLTSIDTKIESVGAQISQTQMFKKGLLQQMFV